MKTFLKTLIGGALGIGALYVVGKVCYEAGRDVAEIERQLENVGADPGDKSRSEEDGEEESVVPELEPEKAHGEAGSDFSGSSNRAEAANQSSKSPEETGDEHPKKTVLDRMVQGVRNTKLFLKARKAFDRDRSDKGPSILSSLLTNPDGAKIEAYVKNGGVQINVRPRAA